MLDSAINILDDNTDVKMNKVLKHSEIYGLSMINHGVVLRILRVRLISVSGLFQKDRFDSNNLYCKLSLYKNSSGISKVGIGTQTKTIKDSLNHRWNEEFLFKVNANENTLKIKMYNSYNLGRDYLRGFVNFNLSELDICSESPTTKIDPKLYRLRPKNPKNLIQGNLLIYIAYLMNNDNLRTMSQNSFQASDSICQSNDALNIEPLPIGWEEKIDQNGKIYYLDHINKRSQWRKPTIAQLPAGWEERMDSDGRVYYLNLNSQKRQWDHPYFVLQNESSSTRSEPTGSPSRRRYKPKRVVSGDGKSNGRSSDTVPSIPGIDVPETFRERHQLCNDNVSNHQRRFKKHKHELQSSTSPPIRPSIRHGTTNNDGNMTSNNDEEILPGWEIGMTPEGRRYFINHNNHTTTWDDPRSNRHRSKSVSSTMPLPVSPSINRTSSQNDLLGNLGPLPPGWEEREHTDGRIFFVDHNNKKTQWEDPRLCKNSGDAVPYNRSYKKKYDYFRSKLREPSALNVKFQIKINRKYIFEDSYRHIYNVKSIEMLKNKLWIEFIGEKGLDYGGLQREWFLLLSQEIFNPSYGLFEYSATDNYKLQINPLSGVANEDHLNYFKFIGRVIGMAIYHGRLMNGFFIRPIYKIILGRKLRLQDMESVDQQYYQSLLYILQNDPGDLNLSFSITEECFGETTEIELIPDGKNQLVTEANKKEYISCVINWRFVKRVQLQMDALLDGFQDVINTNSLKIFDYNELELLLCGLQDIKIQDWKTNTDYKCGYNADHPAIINFWKIVHTFNNELRARLLQFVTGTSRVPVSGFAELWGSNGLHKFTIEKWGTADQLPRAHTCFNRLDLPEYNTFDDMRNKLLFAIENTEGFEGVD